MEDQVLQAQCLKNVVVEERATDGSVASRAELSTALELKKEIGNARLVSDDAMLWVANGSIQSKPVVATDGKDPQQHVTVTNGKRSFSFFLESNADSDGFLNELRAQVAGRTGLEAKRKKRKIRKQIAESQSTGFVPVVNTLKSPMKQAPSTPNRRHLSDSTNSPARLASPLPMTFSTVSEARGVYPSPSKSPFRSPFGKKPTPPPRLASPIVSLSLPPKSPAIHSSATPSPSAPASASSSSSLTSPRPREWLSPVRGGAGRVRPQLTPPSIRRESLTPGGSRRADSSEKENTPVRSSGGGIVNKRVRSLQRMLDDVPREEPENVAGARPPTVRSPFFLSPKNAREMSPVRRPSPAKKLRSPSMPLGELQLNTPPLSRPPLFNATPPSNPTTSAMSDNGLRKVTHGLLNLGNFCYMNAIIQSLAAIPGFADRMQKNDWILPIIKKRLTETNEKRNSQQISELFNHWKDEDPTNRLAIQEKLAMLLQQVITGSDTAINPESLKAVMGRRNPRFASHLQQDAHEFLLNLVSEYEKELVQAVDGILKAATEGERSDETQAAVPSAADQPIAPKKTSLLNFFRPERKDSDSVVAADSTADSAPATTPVPLANASPRLSGKDEEALVSEMFPAECFRAELYRTLTCTACEYSRRQVEQFYDFSLDLPFVPLPNSPVLEPSRQPSPDAESKTPTRQCHCGVNALIIESGGERVYCCAKSSCSLRERVPETAAPGPEQTPYELSSVLLPPAPLATLTAEPDSIRPPGGSIQLADLLKDQFKSEVLELTCEKCKDGKEATARYEVKSLPRVLVLHLKRFEVNPQTGSLYKRSDLVEAPFELFPAKHIHTADGSTAEAGGLLEKRYTIRSVVHHLGRSVDEGHYVADVCGARGSWRRRNDTHETLIGEDFALRASRSQESCYMMFYVLTEPTGSQDRDKENTVTQSPVRSAATTPTQLDSPASLIGRRRENTPPRNASKVSKSLHELL